MSTTVTGYYYGNMKVLIAVFLGLPSINIYCHATSHVSHIFWYILRSMHDLRREITHFRVVSSLFFKAKLSAKLLIWKLLFILMQMSLALSLVSKVRLFGTRKWPVNCHSATFHGEHENKTTNGSFSFRQTWVRFPKIQFQGNLSHTLTFKTSWNNRDKILKNAFWSNVISLPTNTPPTSAPKNIFSPNPVRKA